MDAMRDIGVTAVIEIPPAGTLTGLIKRALPGVETLALKTPDDLPAAWKMINEHGKASVIDTQPTWRMVVAPSKGTFRRADDSMVGDELPVGGAVGVVETLRDTIPVGAPHGGTIVEWLVEDGDPVSPGQPIIRLHPIGQDSHA
jgi:[acyl-carrier-protein] S-malonyltransferase